MCTSRGKISSKINSGAGGISRPSLSTKMSFGVVTTFQKRHASLTEIVSTSQGQSQKIVSQFLPSYSPEDGQEKNRSHPSFDTDLGSSLLVDVGDPFKRLMMPLD